MASAGQGAMRRITTLVTTDLRHLVARPSLWILLLLIFFMTWGMSTGNVRIASGESSVGGETQSWITSEYHNGLVFPLVGFLLYTFFVAVSAGMAVPRDEELKVESILHATRLRPREYIWGKFGAVFLAFLAIFTAHVLLTILFNQILPHDKADLIRGPFELANYLRPFLWFNLPFLIFMCGASMAIGQMTRKPILVFFMPVTLFLINTFFLWSWSPSWLDPRVNKLLMALEPSGFRWINETWLKVDLGVSHYNHEPIGYDSVFIWSRLGYVFLGLGLLVIAARHLSGSLRQEAAPSKGQWRFWRRKNKNKAQHAADEFATADDLLRRPITGLKMRSEVPGFFRTVLDVARFEGRNLKSHPGLYLFVPLILLQTIGTFVFIPGAFDTPILLTPGAAAVRSMNTLTLLVCFLILFYTVESISREWRSGLAPLYYSSPASTGAVLLGKNLANSILGMAIMLAAYIGAAGVMLYQGKVAPSLGPFLLVWGLLLIPTFLVWSAFVTAVFAVVRNRFFSYAIGLAVMAFTGWKQQMGEMNWVGNWNLWGTATWTDFGGLEPNVRALLMNRLFWLAVGLFLVILTVKVFPRRELDASRTIDRLAPKHSVRFGLRMLPWAIPALVLGIFLYVDVQRGYQGEQVERREEEYHGRNLLTWLDADIPDLQTVDLDVTLDPEKRSFKVSGYYDLANDSEDLLRRFPMSVGDHFGDVVWKFNGEDFEPENWAGLKVFELEEPLDPGASFRVDFEYEGVFPKGISKNGGGMGQFILPSGVVLTSFGSNFLPMPLFEFGRGMNEDNRLDAKVYEDGFWEGKTKPGLGLGARFDVRTKITGPEKYQYHGVGVRTSDTVADGLRTVVWETDHPVNFFNIVAGQWESWEGDGVAIYYHPKHDYNLEEMGEALQAARDYFSEWFYPYPWQDLKVSEFPGLATYAQGFPTNITFSEGIGFLTRSQPEAQVAFMVTAHEAAHQWWGNILMPGEGPGGGILSEGMAHFSTLLLIEQVKGLQERIEFAKQIEERYGQFRQVDSERPLVWTDGSKAGDGTVTYDKGGWVFWMLLNHMGREAGMAGYSDFIHRYAVSDDYPLLQDFVAVMREHATDVEAFDAFTEQWFFEVEVPRYRFTEAEVTESGGRYTVEATVENKSTGTMPVEVAAIRGVRFPDEDETDTEPYQEARATVTIGPGETQSVTIVCDFEPEKVLMDPDALVLMLKRDLAEQSL